MEKKIKSVLFLNAYFFPGYRAGGPQQTIANITNVFGDVANIYILTQNHDLGMKKEYKNICTNKWMAYGKGKVKYISSQNFKYKGIKKEYERFDTIFSCSMFEPNTIAVLFIHKLSKKKKALYIAPMGVFSPGAIQKKKLKKIIFLNFFKYLKMFKDITWVFSSEIELKEAKIMMGKKAIADYIIAEDLPKKINYKKYISFLKEKNKEKGKLKIVFISRICEKKNLDYCFELLKNVKNGEYIFDIYGIIEDEKYWEKCRSKMKCLPSNVLAEYKGAVKPEKVVGTFSQYDIFLFPTKGENFGHVIYESLSAGCLPVISDSTPWNMLMDKDAGAVIPYNDIAGFCYTIEKYAKMDNEEMVIKKTNAIKLAEEKYNSSVKNSGYQQVLCMDLGKE